ncbi:DsbA family protein [Vibrio sp.]|uniref:DsbA family protein n=1 Tax=Vibrio sp. TaxID=678 RepID=UPI003D1342AF
MSLAVLSFVVGCQSEDDDKMRSEIDGLKQQITQLTKEVNKIGEQVEKINKLAGKPPTKTLPNQVNFDQNGQIPSLGSNEAKIAIIEFSDFQCPYCKRFSDNTFNQIKEHYIDTGKVRYIARDFPLKFHPQAKGAAIAAMCSFQQQAYWPMRMKLFSNVKQLIQ